MHISIDPVTGQFRESLNAAIAPDLRALLNDLDPLARHVVRWLYGIDCRPLSPEEIANLLDADVADVWLWAEAAIDSLGQSVVLELAA